MITTPQQSGEAGQVRSWRFMAGCGVTLCASATGWVQMRCRECAAEIAATARVCSGCGAPIGQLPVVAEQVRTDTVDDDTEMKAEDQSKRRSWTVRERLQLAFVVVFVVFTGLPAFLIVVLDDLPIVGHWLTDHVPFWDEVTDFYDWLFSHAS